MESNTANVNSFDVVLIGGGIMSATLGVFLKELQPDWKIEIFERLDKVGAESSDALNNAGTGHSALCELNYTPEMPDGSIDISKAIKVAEQFEVSKQFWAYLVKHGYFEAPGSFINSVPHMSLVWGEDNVTYLKKRYEAMKQCCLFSNMQYSDDTEQLKEWIPLVMQHRDPNQKIAATRNEIGTDVNFGSLTRSLFAHLKNVHGIEAKLQHEVHHLHQMDDKRWKVGVKNLATHAETEVLARFVFIGAGGGALPLLEKSRINEGRGFGGFPVSGEWLICKNKAVAERHHAKVYGKAEVGSPPMSVPHLDTRIINGEKCLLFGPYAGFSTKFLKEGSYLDLPLSIHINNIVAMLGAGAHNIGLTEYLVKQVTQTPEHRFKALQDFFPDAKPEDWQLSIAGQRVQVIKRDAKQGGVLEFGTEVINHSDGTIAALLGASPGASTSVSIMLELIHRCFPNQINSDSWKKKLNEMVPTYGKSLAKDEALCTNIRQQTSAALGLFQKAASN